MYLIITKFTLPKAKYFVFYVKGLSPAYNYYSLFLTMSINYQALRFHFNLIKITYCPRICHFTGLSLKKEACVEFPVMMALYKSTSMVSHRYFFFIGICRAADWVCFVDYS